MDFHEIFGSGSRCYKKQLIKIEGDWVPEICIFSFFNIATMPCLYAVQLTAVGNSAVMEHVLKWGNPSTG